MHSRLVNELYQDPLLYTWFDDIPDRLLFDCGYMFGLPARDIQKISSVYVSHTHFDHFMGFDHMLRMCIEQDRQIELYGPRGFIDQVVGKLSGYSWNLCEDLGLNFKIREYSSSLIEEITLYGKNAYKQESERTYFPFSEVITVNESYTVSTAILDHKIPSMAFSVKQNDFLKVRKDILDTLNLKPGPWLGALKKEVESGLELQNEDIEMPDGRKLSKAELAEKMFEVRNGKKVSYVVDTIFSDETVDKICRLIDASDEFYCECTFLSSDEEKAVANHHLTAKQAGTLARLGNVARLIPIHLSKRYGNRYWELIKEAGSEFGNIELPEKYLNVG